MAEAWELQLGSLEHRIERLERESQKSEESRNRLYARLEPLEKENAVTAVQYAQIMGMLNEMKEDIKTLKETPKRRLDSIATTVISVSITAVLTFIISYVLH